MTVQMCEIEGCDTRACLTLVVDGEPDHYLERWVCAHHAWVFGDQDMRAFIESLGQR